MKMQRNATMRLEDGSTLSLDLEKVRSASQTLSLNFDSGVAIDVDLAKVEMTDEQRKALDKLLGYADRIDEAQCVDDQCPAQQYLSSKEFELVRGLNAGLTGAGTRYRGPIIDFCLHVIIVGLPGMEGPIEVEGPSAQ